MGQKRVSVIVPTYKRPLFLKRAINSVLCQNYDNIEILVVDDNNDGDQYRKETEKVMAEYSGNAKVIYLKHKINSNGSAARNTGLQNASGDYIAFLDDDDFFLNERIKSSVSFLDSSSSDIGGCCVNYIKKYKSLIYKRSEYDCVSSDCGNLLAGNVDYGAGSTLMIKRCVLDDVKGYDTTFRRHQDWEFLIRVFRNYKIVNLPILGVVISADGIRNNPNTDLLIEMKKKIFTEFDSSIKLLPESIYKNILKGQRLEILHSFLVGRKYSRAIDFYKSTDEQGCVGIKDIPHLVLSLIVGLLPNFMVFVYWIYSLKYRGLNTVVENAEKNYSSKIVTIKHSGR